jgi:hypothetical protein
MYVGDHTSMVFSEINLLFHLQLIRIHFRIEAMVLF